MVLSKIDHIGKFLNYKIPTLYNNNISLDMLYKKKICMNLSLYIQQIKNITDENIKNWICMFISLLSTLKKYDMFCYMYIDYKSLYEDYEKLNNKQIQDKIKYNREKLQTIYVNIKKEVNDQHKKQLKNKYVMMSDTLKKLEKQNIEPKKYFMIIKKLVNIFGFPLIDLCDMTTDEITKFIVKFTNFMDIDYIIDNNHQYIYYDKILVYNLDFITEQCIIIQPTFIREKLMLTYNQYKLLLILIDNISKNNNNSKFIYTVLKDSRNFAILQNNIKITKSKNKSIKQLIHKISNTNLNNLQKKYEINSVGDDINKHKYNKIKNKCFFKKIRFDLLLKYICKNSLFIKIDEITKIIVSNTNDIMKITELLYIFK
jgi:hypothetical protein